MFSTYSSTQKVCKCLLKKHLLLLAFLFILSFVSCTNSKVYKDRDLEIALEIPHNWNLERTERLITLQLYPEGIDEKADPVSIEIFRTDNSGENLSAILERELKRFQQAKNLTELFIVHELEDLSNPQFEVAVAKFSVPVENEIGLNDNHNTQPAELIVLKSKEYSIICWVLKSNIDEILNAQVDEIVSSIYIINGD